MMEELFFEVGAILVLAAGLSFVSHRLRLPLIIAYLVTGILAGPSVLGLVRSPEVYGVMSQIGIAFLLFTVGMGLNWRTVKEVGGVAFATGVGQVLMTSVIGFLIASMFGIDPVTSLFVSVAFSFSSTIIIVKLLMDKEELDTLYGRISVGFLLVQDFIAMFLLLGLNALRGGNDWAHVLLFTLVKLLVVVPCLWVISTKIIPPIVRYAARSQELLLVFAVAWCFLIAGALHAIGFGIELGALLAGIALSGTVFENEINARIRPLRDFFLIVFFIVLGTNLSAGSLHSILLPSVVFTIFVLIGNPLSVMLVLRSLGYHPRTGFLAGTTVAQISEFSFIMISAGVVAGYVAPEAIPLTTLVGLATIAGSSYLIAFNEQAYQRLAWMFRWLEPARAPLERAPRLASPQWFLFGFHRVGVPMLETVRTMGKPYVIVDFDPQVVRELSEIGEPVLYGDAGDRDFLAELGVEHGKVVISTIPDLAVSLSLLRYLQSRHFAGIVIVCARTPEDAGRCYDSGATYVLVPSILGGEKFRELLERLRTRRSGWQRLAKEDLTHRLTS